MSDWKQNALTPKELCVSDMNYSAVDDLLGAIKHDEIKNIALAGPYGSGKSSILKTFIKKITDSDLSKDFNVLELSLGTLEIDDSLKENESVKEDKADNVEAEGTDDKTQSSQQSVTQANKNDKEELQIEYHERPRHTLSPEKKAQLNKDIECGILKQLIYRKKNENLPYSRFKKISHYSATTIRSIASYTIGYVLCIGYAFNISFLQIPFSYDAINNLSYEVRCVAFIILIAMSYDILMKFIKTWGGKQLQKISVAGNDIEIKDDCSVFNTYFEEILYFFQCTDYNVVIFEDLDRFNYPEIFIKLRELNYLLNKSEMVGRPVKFIYAVKDDIFKNYSRAKFFDYIATVIPVITAYNSKSVLKEELNKLEHEEIPEDKLESIAFHIDDMRLLKNIVNEFDQYMKKLNKNDVHLDPAKMLAMITVKNYHPHDFSELQFRKGKLYAALSPEARRKYIEFAINQIMHERIKNAENDLNIERAIADRKATDLRRKYMDVIKKKRGFLQYQKFKINNMQYDDEKIISDDRLFKELTQNKLQQYDLANEKSVTLPFEFSEIEKEIDPIYTYKDKCEQIYKETEKIKDEIKKIEEEKKKINTKSIKDLLEDYSIYKEKSFRKIGLSDMEEDFIRQELLDESYNEYISFQYSESGELSDSDRKLYISMTLDRPTYYGDIIEHTDSFVKRLPNKVFSYESVWNFHLVTYLFNNKDTYSDAFKTIIYSFVEKDSYDFFELFYARNESDTMEIYRECMNVDQDVMWRKALKKNEDAGNNNIKMWLRTFECDIDKITDEQRKYIKMHYDLIASIYDYFDDKHKDFFVNFIFEYNRLTDRNDEMLEKVVKRENYDANNYNMSLVVKKKHAYDDIAMLSNEYEMEYALKANAVNPTWHNLNVFSKMKDIETEDTIRYYIKDNIEQLLQDKSYMNEEYDDLFNSIQTNKRKYDTKTQNIIYRITNERQQVTRVKKQLS